MKILTQGAHGLSPYRNYRIIRRITRMHSQVHVYTLLPPFVPVALRSPIVLPIVLRGVGPLVRTSSKA